MNRGCNELASVPLGHLKLCVWTKLSSHQESVNPVHLESHWASCVILEIVL